MAGLQYYDITIPANFQRSIGSEGTYFRYMKGSAGGADEGLLVKADTGALAAIIYPGQSIRLPETVREWRIENYKNAGTISGIVVIGDGEIQDSQVAGMVSVIDGGKARTLADVAKAGSFWCGQLAGNYSHVQLWNPPGSGKNLIVEQVGIVSDVTTIGISMVLYNTQLTSLYAGAVSKKSGGAVSVSSGYYQTNASQLGGAANLFLLNHGNLFIPKEPIIVTPGYGLVVRGQGMAQGVQGSFEFYEEPT
jgi:hypothetical protein